MILKIVLLILAADVVYGYFGCPHSFLPCSNETNCVSINEICVHYSNCTDGQGGKIECHDCSENEPNSTRCVVKLNGRRALRCLPKNQTNQQHCEVQHECSTDQFACGNGTCLNSSKVCNGIKDCLDGNDEINCTNPKITIIEKSCSKSVNNFDCLPPDNSMEPICISLDQVCDKITDCQRGEDESDCNSTCPSENTFQSGHNVTCIDHPILGKIYRCLESGFRTKLVGTGLVKYICEDFDECQDSSQSFCSFKCINTFGGFNCTCPDGFKFDLQTKRCEYSDLDLSRPNLFALVNQTIFYFMIHSRAEQDYHNSPTYEINLGVDVHAAYIGYDVKDNFVIYYHPSERSINCHSNHDSKSITLIQNIDVHKFTYDSNEKSLYVLDAKDETINFYSRIVCNSKFRIKKHQWHFGPKLKSIEMISVDINLGQIIFASDHEFLVANISEPNVTKAVYLTNRSMSRPIYDSTFQRLFWVSLNHSSTESFPVFTCDIDLKRCYDTFVRSSNVWPYTFLHESLIYSNKLMNKLESTKIYGKKRFETKYLLGKNGIFHYLSTIYYPSNTKSSCFNGATEKCPNQLCYPIGREQSQCLSIDEIIMSKDSDESDEKNKSNSDRDQKTSNKNKDSKTGYVITIIFLVFVGLAFLVLGAIFISRRFYPVWRQNMSDRLRRDPQTHQLMIDEPVFEEFNTNFERTNDRLPLADQVNY